MSDADNPTPGGQSPFIQVGNPLPEREHHVQSGGSKETTKLSPEQLAAQAEQDTVTKQQLAALPAKTDLAKQQADATATADEFRTAVDQDAARRRLEAEDRARPIIEQAKARLQAAEAKYAATPAPSLFGDSEGWGKARKVLALAMGGIGDAIQRAAMVRIGQAPPNVDTVKQIIDADTERQREKIAKLKDDVVIARTGIKDAADARQAMLDDVEVRAAAKYKQADNFLRARLSYLKKSQPEIDAKSEELGLLDKAAQHHIEAARPTAVKVQQTYGATDITRENTARQQKTDADIANQEFRNEAGKAVALVPKSRGGVVGFAKDDAQLGRTIEGLEKLLKDVKENGERVWRPEAIKRRETLHNSAGIGIGAVSPIGTTDEAKKMEIGSIGPSGVPDLAHPMNTVMGANPEAIQRKIDELKVARERVRRQTLSPLPGHSEILSTDAVAPPAPITPPAFTPTQQAAAAAGAPAPFAPPPPPAAPSLRDQAIRLLRANPNRTGAAQIKKKFNITPEELRGG